MFKTHIARFSQFLTWPFLFILFNIFFVIKIKGRENLKKISSPVLIISNHIAFYDSFIFRLVCGLFSEKLPLRFMAVRRFSNSILNTLTKIGLIDFLYILFGVFVVEPGRGIHKNIGVAEDIINKGGNVVVYPEGSVYKEGEVQKFKLGAALLTKKTGVAVLPVAMKFGEKRFFRREYIINVGERIRVKRNMPVREMTERFRSKVMELYEEKAR